MRKRKKQLHPQIFSYRLVNNVLSESTLNFDSRLQKQIKISNVQGLRNKKCTSVDLSCGSYCSTKALEA